MVWMWTEVDRKTKKSTSQNFSKKIELKAMANQTFRKEPEAQVMCFMRNYAERYDWFEQTLQDYQIENLRIGDYVISEVSNDAYF